MNTRIEPIYLTSSNIDAVGYLEVAKRLFIRFKSGGAYSYENVPYDFFSAIQKVESAGGFFARQIRGKFHYTRLDSDPFSI